MATLATLDSLLSDAANTSAFYSLNKLAPSEITSIWEAMCVFIQEQMVQRKGVIIPGLGTFCFSLKKIFLGQKESVDVSRPMFILSTAMGAQGQKPHVSGQLSLMELNFSAISQLAGRSRDNVMGCIKEMLMLFKRTIEKGQSLLLVFSGICSLYFRSKKVKVKFFQEFLDSLGIPDNYTSRLFSPFSPSSSSIPLSDSHSASPSFKGETPTLPQISHSPGKPPISPAKPPLFSVTNSGKPASKLSIVTKATFPPASTDPRSRTKSAPTPGASSGSKLSHHRGEAAGDGMCPCCEMRSARNATPPPVDGSKLAHGDGKEQLKFQMEQDAAVIARDLMALAKRRKENKEVSAQNWSASEGRHLARKVRSQSTEPSYLFHSRSTTPSRYLKQHEYWTDLAQQVKDKQFEMELALRLTKDAEKLDQQRLTQAMARESQLYHQQRLENARIYHDTLDYQVTSRQGREQEVKEPILKGEGVDLIQLELNRHKEKREQAKQLYKEQRSTSEQKKQVQLETTRTARAVEALQLSATKKQLVQDRETSFKDRQEKYSQLAKSWDQSIAERKGQEEFEEREEKKEYISILDQTSRYERCKQCQREGANRGTSNVLRDTRYIAGSRHMT